MYLYFIGGPKHGEKIQEDNPATVVIIPWLDETGAVIFHEYRPAQYYYRGKTFHLLACEDPPPDTEIEAFLDKYREE